MKDIQADHGALGVDIRSMFPPTSQLTAGLVITVALSRGGNVESWWQYFLRIYSSAFCVFGVSFVV